MTSGRTRVSCEGNADQKGRSGSRASGFAIATETDAPFGLKLTVGAIAARAISTTPVVRMAWTGSRHRPPGSRPVGKTTIRAKNPRNVRVPNHPASQVRNMSPSPGGPGADRDSIDVAPTMSTR